MGKSVFSYRSLPHWGRGTAPAVDRVLSYIVDLRRSPSLSFIPLSPSNLCPFGAPPSIGRRECPREPLPLEGAAERSEAGLASFFAAKPPSLSLPHWGRGTASAVDRVLSLIVDLRCIFSLSFIPLEPYPARYARHLPHAGKAGDTRETCHPQTFGHRPIYICGEAATTTLNPEPSNPFHFPLVKDESCII